MNAKRARAILSCRRPGGQDDGEPRMQEALAVAEQEPALKELLAAQSDFDNKIAAALQHAFQTETKDQEELAESARRLLEHKEHRRMAFGSPAMIAVGVAFVFLAGVLVWHFLGRAGVFPDEAVKIAATGMKGGPELFSEVEEKAGNLPDWFVLKGFDHFKVPAGFEDFPAVGVRIFKIENQPVAMTAIADSNHKMFFFSFESAPFGISIVPQKKWMIAESEQNALAIRQDETACFMIAMRGRKADMERLLENVAK